MIVPNPKTKPDTKVLWEHKKGVHEWPGIFLLCTIYILMSSLMYFVKAKSGQVAVFSLCFVPQLKNSNLTDRMQSSEL